MHRDTTTLYPTKASRKIIYPSFVCLQFKTYDLQLILSPPPYNGLQWKMKTISHLKKYNYSYTEQKFR